MSFVGKHLTNYFALISGIVALLPSVLISTALIPSLSDLHSSFQQVLVSIFSVLVIAFIISNRHHLSQESLTDRPRLLKWVRVVPYACVVIMIACSILYVDVTNNRSEATDLTWPIFAFAGIFVMPTTALSLLGIWEYKKPTE